MNEMKIRVLGIAPYEGMSSMMKNLAEQRDDLDLDVFVGDLEKGVEIVKNNDNSKYDAIISRGGTAELIGQSFALPVIEISLSVYDILRAIKLAENYSDQYAIVGFPAITVSAHLLCDLLQYRIDIFPIHNESEVQNVLTGLKSKGYRMVLCDMITHTLAKELGLNAILITSGTESIQTSFDQAVKICRGFTQVREENRFYTRLLKDQDQDTVVFDSDKSICFSTLERESDIFIQEILSEEVEETLSAKSHKFFKNIQGKLYAFVGKSIRMSGKHYAAFYFSPSNVPMAGSKYGIKYSSLKEVENHFFNSFYSITSTIGMQNLIEQINETHYPVMILGEVGTGKEQVAGILYAQSSFSSNPLITINCSLLTDKGWAFLTNHYNSPLNDNNNTIYFQNLDSLTEERNKYLLSIIIDGNLTKRNRVLFSCVCNPSQCTQEKATEYVNTLSCMTICLPPLRERSEDIPALSSLYLNTLNLNLAKQIIGFEPDALNLLMEYSWPYNYTQFKRILSEISVITTTPYISFQNVQKLLSKEETGLFYESNNINVDFNIHQSLNEINKDIINMVLKENGGNQSAAAKQLGIGRTTLWRYLNEK